MTKQIKAGTNGTDIKSHKCVHFEPFLERMTYTEGTGAHN